MADIEEEELTFAAYEHLFEESASSLETALEVWQQIRGDTTVLVRFFDEDAFQLISTSSPGGQGAEQHLIEYWGHWDNNLLRAEAALKTTVVDGVVTVRDGTLVDASFIAPSAATGWNLIGGTTVPNPPTHDLAGQKRAPNALPRPSPSPLIVGSPGARRGELREAFAQSEALRLHADAALRLSRHLAAHGVPTPRAAYTAAAEFFCARAMLPPPRAPIGSTI